MFDAVTQQIWNGISVGGVYALIAVGLTLVYGVLYQANFAHCEQYMLAGYVLFFCLGAGIGFPVAALLAVATAGLIGLVFYRLLWRPTMEKPHTISVLIFFGASVTLSSAVMAFYNPNAQAVSVPFYGNILHFGGLAVTQGRLMTVIISVVLLVMVHLFVTRTRLGTAMRAVAQDSRTANLMGINIYRIGMVTFALAGVLAGIGAILIVPLYGTVSPMCGFGMVIRAFCIIILGGLGNVPGTIAAAFIIGLLENILAGLVWAPLKDLIPWVTVIMILWLRPQGLFGRVIRRA